MPWMTRKEIIDEYGIDPETEGPSKEQGGTSVVGKATDSQESVPVNVGDPIENRNDETPTAPVGNNFVAGILKSFGSDPLGIVGLGYGVTKYALNKAFSDGDYSFADSLYQPGGINNVKNFVNEYAKRLQSEHPDWDKAKLLDEVDKFQQSDEFFFYNTGQMTTPMQLSLRAAYGANTVAGVDKLPSQETMGDAVAQTLGGLAIPMPGWTKISSLATRTVANRAGRIAGHVIDATVMPGTRLEHFGPGSFGAGLVGGTAIDEAVRYSTGQNSLINGRALGEWSKIQDEMNPAGQQMQMPDGTGTGAELMPELLPQDSPAAAAGTSPEQEGTPPTGGGSTLPVATAILGFGAAMRGRFHTRLNNIDLGGAGEGITRQAERMRERAGINPEVNPNVVVRQAEDFDTAINRDAPVEQLARDLDPGQRRGLEADTQAELGLTASEQSRTLRTQRYLEDGVLPDGTTATVNPRIFMSTARRMSQEDRDVFSEGVVAINAYNTRRDAFNAAQQEIQDLTQQLATTPAGNARRGLLARMGRAQITSREAHNINFPNVTTPELQQIVQEMSQNQNARQLFDMYQNINRDRNNAMYRSGLIDAETLRDWNSRPYHVPLFEMRGSDYQMFTNRDLTVPITRDANGNQIAAPRIAVDRVPDPFSAVATMGSKAVDAIAINNARDRIIRRFVANDPGGEEVRYIGPRSRIDNGNITPPLGERNLVNVWRNGREETYQFARGSVADALKMQPLQLSPSLWLANRARRGFQWLTTGPIGFIPTALNTLGYDIFSGTITRRAGRPFGIISGMMHAVAGRNRFFREVVNKLDVFDPTSAVVAGSWILRAPFWKAWGAVGESLMDAAIRQDSWLGSLATTPQARQELLRIGGWMSRAFEMSTIGVMKEHNAYQTHSMLRDAYGAQSRLEQIASQFRNAGADRSFSGRTLRGMYEIYMGMLDNISSAAKYAMASQGLAQLRREGRDTPQQIARLMEEVRRIGGDMTGVPGSGLARGTFAMLPYANITAQATRHLYHAAFTQGPSHSATVMLRLVGVAGAAYGGIKLVESMGEQAQQWYYNQPQWQRVGNILMPSPKAMAYYAEHGTWPQFDMEKPDDNFMRISISPELQPYTQAVLAGLESFGLIDRGKNLGDTSIKRDIAQAGGNAIGNTTLMPLQILSAISGTKVDFLANMQGRGVTQEVQGPRGQGINTGNLPSGIPTNVGETLRVVFGLAGDIAVNMADAGLQHYNHNKNAIDALNRAFDEGRFRMGQRMPKAPGLWDATSKTYTGTAVSDRIYGTMKDMELLNKQWSLEFSPQTGMMYRNSALTSNRDVARLMNYAHQALSTGGAKELTDRISRIRGQLDNLNAGKDRFGPEQIEQQRADLSKKLRAAQDRMAAYIERVEDRLARRAGPLFEQEGAPPTIKGLNQLIKKYNDRYRRRPN